MTPTVDYPQDTPEERHPLNRPYLTIPYWTPKQLGAGDPGDVGDVRPLPSGVISYLCPGIAPLTPFVPGSPLTVQVAVRNSGGGNTTGNAVVTVWWEYPSTGFAQMLASRMFGVRSVAVPPRGATNFTTPITNLVPLSAGPHICLVARVSHARDAVPVNTLGNQTPDPGGERHWAQRNVAYLPSPPGGVIDFSFWAANPEQREAEFLLDVRPFRRGNVESLTRVLKAEPIHAEATFQIREVRDLSEPRSQRREGAQSVFLPAGGRRAMHLRMNVTNGPSEGQCAGFEIVQRRRDDDHLVGGIALIVVPSRDQAGR
jgi:hypothetical protein